MLLPINSKSFLLLLCSCFFAVRTLRAPSRLIRHQIHSCKFGVDISDSAANHLSCANTEHTDSISKCTKHFINLTNGLEALPILVAKGVSTKDISFCRLQSTHCEAAAYNSVLETIDDNLLMHLALGYVCLIYDFGSRGTGMYDHRDGIPRAFWWGTEWLRHVLSHFWGLEDAHEPRMVRGYNAKGEFDSRLRQIPKSLRRRFKYYKTYVRTKRIFLYPIYAKTAHDGIREFYVDTVTDYLNAQSNENQSLIANMPHASTEGIDAFVNSTCIPPGMYLYHTNNFEGYFGWTRNKDYNDTQEQSLTYSSDPFLITRNTNADPVVGKSQSAAERIASGLQKPNRFTRAQLDAYENENELYHHITGVMAEERQEGVAEGLSEGRAAACREVATAMIKQLFSDAIILATCNITNIELNELKNVI